MIIGYWWECRKEEDHCEEQGVGGWTSIKMDLREIGWYDMAEDGDQ
jgi:hypothetical protein